MYVYLYMIHPVLAPPSPTDVDAPPPVGWAAQVPIGSIAVGPHPWSCAPPPPLWDVGWRFSWDGACI